MTVTACPRHNWVVRLSALHLPFELVNVCLFERLGGTAGVIGCLLLRWGGHVWSEPAQLLHLYAVFCTAAAIAGLWVPALGAYWLVLGRAQPLAGLPFSARAAPQGLRSRE